MCVVVKECVCWEGHYILVTQRLDGKKEGKVSGKDLPQQGANPRMFAQLDFTRPLECVHTCVCVCVMQLYSVLQPKAKHLLKSTKAEISVRAHTGYTQFQPQLCY